jgi:hypothetical protein
MSSLADFLGTNIDPVFQGDGPVMDQAQWPSRIKHLSATSIAMFRRCPEQFRHRYILGEKERPGEGLVIGSMFHETLEYNYSQKIESHEDRPLTEVIQYLQDEAVPKVLLEQGGADEIAWDSQDPVKGVALARTDSERITAAYHNTVVPRLQPISLEEKLILEDARLPVPLIGYIDLKVGTEVVMDTTSVWTPDRVIDTKTGKQSASKLKPSWMLQGDLYAAMSGLTVEYHSISRAKTPKITTALESQDLVVQPNDVRKENILNTASQIAGMISWMYGKYGPDETWPTLGRFADFSMSFSPCGMCGWRQVCPAMQGEV